MKSTFLRVLLVAVNLVVLVLLFEIASNFVFISENKQFFYARERLKRESSPATNPFMSGDFRVVLHPYYGYGYAPNVDPQKISYLKINNHGFLFHPDYVRQRPGCCDYPSVRSDPDELIVAIFGGSVAGAFAYRLQESKALREALTAIPRFAGKRIRVLQFAFGGHKQPQQLMILTYYLSLGQPFDVLINIDGFNEMSTAPGNIVSGVEANYPGQYMWRRLVDFLERQAAQARNPEGVLANYHLIMSQRWALRATNCRTATCYSLARLVRSWHQSNAGGTATSAPSAGPPFFFKIDPAPARTQGEYDMVADRWVEASRLMQQLARSRNMLYVHALQPNQWFRRTTPYVPRDPGDVAAHFKRTVPIGYAALIAKGPMLRDLGVNYVDASAILDNEPDSIYSDDVGHYMPRGNDLLAQAIFQALAAPEHRSDGIHRGLLDPPARAADEDEAARQ